MSDFGDSKSVTDTGNTSVVSVDGSERTELLSKARAFLRSPSVASQDIAARRHFLSEKGLSSDEIETVISAVPPPIPPRTYPRPAPSKLPIILYATLKAFILLTGVSVVSIAVYFTYIYPRLAASFGARAQLQTYQTGLLKKLVTTSEDTRSMQKFYSLKSTEVAMPAKEEGTDVPKSGHHEGDDPASNIQPEDTSNKQILAETSQNEYESLSLALRALKRVLPRRKAAYNSTLSDMSDMTALITSRMYAPKAHTAIEGEIRKEIRAAKGLLLNRKTFTSHKSLTP